MCGLDDPGKWLGMYIRLAGPTRVTGDPPGARGSTGAGAEGVGGGKTAVTETTEVMIVGAAIELEVEREVVDGDWTTTLVAGEGTTSLLVLVGAVRVNVAVERGRLLGAVEGITEEVEAKVGELTVVSIVMFA